MPRKYTEAEAEAAFWSRVNKDGPTQPHMETRCWEWLGSRNPGGYGMVRWSRWRARSMWGVHRVAFAIQFGGVPPGVDVLHRCDFPACCRPDHLWAGTHTDNMRDKKRKGRGVGSTESEAPRPSSPGPRCGRFAPQLPPARRKMISLLVSA